MHTKKKQRGGVIRIRSEVTHEELKRIESTETRLTDAPDALPRASIKIADKVFQWRLSDEDMESSEAHVRTLVQMIGTGKERKALEPVLVTAVGQSFYLVDGHHRIDAYHTAKWTKRIPVEVFDGSLRDARDAAFARNANDKLPMTPEAKRQAAWVRFNERDLTWEELSDRFQVSRSTVANMAKARRALLDANEDPSSVLWRDARKHEWTPLEDFDYKAHVNKAALVMAERLKGVSNFTKDAEITAKAIAILSAGMPDALTEAWRGEADFVADSEDTWDEVSVDVSVALPIVTGKLAALGQARLAQQVEDALREALAELAAGLTL